MLRRTFSTGPDQVALLSEGNDSIMDCFALLSAGLAMTVVGKYGGSPNSSLRGA
jgi:hypothetical protein